MQNYSTVASRNLIRAEYEMLKHAEPVIVLGAFGTQKEQPLNKTDTVVFRRLKPFNAASNETPDIDPADFITAEGTTPDANTIDYTDVTTTLQQYAVLFRFSSKVALMYEDDIPKDMQKQTGETLAEVAELINYGVVKAGSNVIYANGSTRAGLNTTISLDKLRQASRTLENNRGKLVTSTIKAGPDFDTSAVEQCYIVFCSSDMVADIRDLPGFTKRVEYGSAIKPVHEREFGAVEDFRFVRSPLFSPYLAGGDTYDGSMVSAGEVSNDVYPLMIIAEDAWGTVSLKGHGVTSISPTIIPANKKNHANPLGMFGYVGADFWLSSVRLNENWMIRIEACATKLS